MIQGYPQLSDRRSLRMASLRPWVTVGFCGAPGWREVPFVIRNNGPWLENGGVGPCFKKCLKWIAWKNWKWHDLSKISNFIEQSWTVIHEWTAKLVIGDLSWGTSGKFLPNKRGQFTATKTVGPGVKCWLAAMPFVVTSYSPTSAQGNALENEALPEKYIEVLGIEVPCSPRPRTCWWFHDVPSCT